ncbi:MAG: nucleotide sugar dehydrogenase [Prochlorococcus marinus CUG1430]|uniref:nucleotide sugar dehydrogenase n=1 Tax=Prochlorococcus marinus TaxID=1219 RepID=UPI001AD9FD1A|nr:nucleotide sugar dehydrogenase [Prochlorococcus marinus]MBW3055308.1 nucleotide sugar dehydrogenase [Prochlorococcus marinus str. MU1411]MCR8537050.1 nucleotide sugar dehydrogenase [Prochlorococcus marinus CUG1430]
MNYKIKNICCIGAGFVGGPSMAVIASKCPNINVTVVDINEKRIEAWNDKNLSNLPIYEPGLDVLIKKCRDKNLFFKTNIEQAIFEADMIFLSVNTPTKQTGVGAGQALDLRWVEASARQISKFSTGNTIVVEKSTLPVRTAETVKSILISNKDSLDKKNMPNSKSFSVLSNPEFLAEGTSINDLENPDRVLIGGDDLKAIEALENIYLNWVEPQKILKTNLWSSELSKLTANAFLAQRISSINSISAICESTGADISDVAEAVGMDNRIGSNFLKAGPGFGGSCFKKDILNLVYLSNYYGLEEVASYWEKILDINNWQQKRISEIIVHKLFGTLSNKCIGILGFAFKANTNDTRESPAINICRDLIEEGAKLKIYDPKVNNLQIDMDLKNACISSNVEYSSDSWLVEDNLYKTANNSDALVVLTEWEEFANINWHEISCIMRSPSWLFDTRGITNKYIAKKNNINIWQVGV